MSNRGPRSDERLLVIAVDGPVASGKTVVGRALATRLGWAMLDTGIMYRALTWTALERATPLDDPKRLTDLAQSVELRVEPPQPGSAETAAIYVDGADATPHLREKRVEVSVSAVAAVPGVRERMVAAQREIVRRGRMVMVGRDIGTVVAPDALVKIYLDASPEVRAKRRATEMRAGGLDVSDGEVLEDLHTRDALDAGRATSPLCAALGAAHLDTSDLDLEGAVAAAIRIVERRLPLETTECAT